MSKKKRKFKRTPKRTPKSAGRPTKLTPAIILEAEGMATIGVAIRDMASIWGVDDATAHRWKQRSPDFAAALKKGEGQKCRRLLFSMFKNATERMNPALQIFLAKNWLGMRDVQDLTAGEGPIMIQIVPAGRNGRLGGGNGGKPGGDGDGKP